ncbi:MAG: hypothetical protein AAB368_12540, partial [bacterium]
MIRPDRDRMPAAFASLLVTVGYLALAERLLEGRSVFGFALRPPGILKALRGSGAPGPAAASNAVASETGASREARASVNALFRELARGSRRRLRIAYLGDSIIEGDLITADLRADLQARFGGKGVGCVDFATPFAGLRKTIRETAGSGWRHWQIGVGAPPPVACGLGGTLAMAPADRDTAWLRFAAPKGRWKGDFPAAELLYGAVPAAGPGVEVPAVIATSPRGRNVFLLAGRGVVNRLRVLDGPAPWLELRFTGAAQVPLFALDVSAGDGVFVDNFALRGCAGGELSSIPAETLRGFQALLAYDLVVLHFGINVQHPRPEDYRLYERSLRWTLRHLAESLPGVPLVMVSAPDRGFRTEAGMSSPPHLPYVLEAQRAAAAEAGAAYYNLFGAMGGTSAAMMLHRMLS